LFSFDAAQGKNKMNRKHVAVFLLLFGLSACAARPVSESPRIRSDPAVVNSRDLPYQIGVDDKLQVVVWRNPDLSVTVPVRPDGKISVPLIGDVQASGITPMEVANSVKNKLSYFIRDPNVSVIVTEMQSHDFMSRVRVTGAVRTPQTFPYRPGMTVLDAVLQAGGVNDFAAPNRTRLHRKSSSKTEVIPIELGTLLKKGGLEGNIEVQPGDVISVPERLF